MDSLDTDTSYAELSMILLQQVRDRSSTSDIQDRLATVSQEELQSDLDTEPKKKAFWLNIYNAYVQILLLDDPD